MYWIGTNIKIEILYSFKSNGTYLRGEKTYDYQKNMKKKVSFNQKKSDHERSLAHGLELKSCKESYFDKNKKFNSCSPSFAKILKKFFTFSDPTRGREQENAHGRRGTVWSRIIPVQGPLQPHPGEE